MEANNDQAASRGSAVRASRLRYPLRSASKPEEATDVSAQKRGKAISDVTKSVNVLDLSGKDRSAKPPRRFSVATKPAPSPSPRVTQSGSNTPNSVRSSQPIARPKFSTISSVSYWLTQIKLAESASKHSISLGFFKLALESGCEPLDRIREELKSYISKHNLKTELTDSVNHLLQIYNITEDFENLNISNSNKSSDSPKKSTESKKSTATKAKRNGNLKPKSLNSETVPSVQVSNSNNNNNKKENAVSRVRVSYNKNPAKQVNSKNPKKPKKEKQGDGGKENEIGLENKPIDGPIPIDVPPKEEVLHEEKENVEGVAPLVEIEMVEGA